MKYDIAKIRLIPTNMNRQLEILYQLAAEGDAWAQEQLENYEGVPRFHFQPYYMIEGCRSTLNLLVDMTQYPLVYDSLEAMYESACDRPLPERSRNEIKEWIVCGWYHMARRLDELGDRLGFVYNHFALMSLNDALGQCHPEGRVIAVASQMLLQPKILIDNVLVHELCHLLYPHHRPTFWRLFNEAIAELGFETAETGKETDRKIWAAHWRSNVKNRRINTYSIVNRAVFDLYNNHLSDDQRQTISLRFDSL